MLRRVPTTTDGKVVDRLQESTRVNKPFKPPTCNAIIERVQPKRKRKAVSYKDAQGDDSDSDSGTRKKKKRNENDGTWTEEELLARAANKKYPVYKPKPFEQVFSARRFSMPSMKNKSGEVVRLVPTNMSLGIRPPVKIIPRPLHDPMEDHAIVLYDPTVDDRETEEEKQEREREEEKEKAAKEAREKTAGLFNPHKSLKLLLGGGQEDKKKVDKVPVVIDPRLSKVLRPHQVEGVKVSVFFALPSMLELPHPFVIVSLQVHHGYARGKSIWLYYGRRDGPRKDFAMHRPPLDITQTIATSGEASYREVHYRVSLKFSQELGPRTW